MPLDNNSNSSQTKIYLDSNHHNNLPKIYLVKHNSLPNNRNNKGNNPNNQHNKIKDLIYLDLNSLQLKDNLH